MADPTEILQVLIALSRELGAEHRGLAILGEGNVSAKLNDDTFFVKASGSSLGTLDRSRCNRMSVRAALGDARS